jgi:hypothetical protein
VKPIDAVGIALIEPGDAVTWIWHNYHSEYEPSQIWANDGLKYTLTKRCILLSKTPTLCSTTLVEGEHITFPWKITVLTTNNEVVPLSASDSGVISGFVRGCSLRCVREKYDE